MMRGIVAGVLGLSLLEAVVHDSAATANATGLIGFVSRGLARWLDPYTPLIPNIAHWAPDKASSIPGFMDPWGIVGKITGAGYTPPVTTPLPVGANVGSTGKVV